MASCSHSTQAVCASLFAVGIFICGMSVPGSSQGDAGWWKGLFKGTQKSICDSAAAEPPRAPLAPGVTIWETPVEEADEAEIEEVTAAAEETRPTGAFIEQYDKRIASLDSAWHTEAHALRGFRVQIFSGSLQAAREVRAKARRSTGDWPVYLSSMPPNYRVSIGDFRTRWEAQKVQDAWMNAFPMAIVIPMDINLPMLDTKEASTSE